MDFKNAFCAKFIIFRKREESHKKTACFKKIIIFQSVRSEVFNKIAKHLLKILNEYICLPLVEGHNAIRMSRFF